MSKPNGSRIDVNWRMEWLRVGDLQVDDAGAQRPWNKARSEKIGRNLDPDRLEMLAVNRRKDASLFVMDGQHRARALQGIGWSNQLVMCRVHDGLSRAEEAALFVELNSERKAVRPFDKFMARIVAQEPGPCAIRRIVETCGMALYRGPGDGHVAAVCSLESTYRSSEKDGGLILQQTLVTIRDAWGRRSQNFNGTVIEGIGAVQLRHIKALDQARFVSVLARIPAGATGLLGRAANLKEIRGAKLHLCLASVCVDAYNKGLRNGKVEDWGL